MGDNARAARAAGIRVDRVRLAVFVLSGASAALAAILYTGRLQGASYTLGEQDLLTVIAAVVIGGTRLFGGEGSVIGALAGSLLMGMLTNGLILWGLTSSEQLIAQGVLLLLAISLTLAGGEDAEVDAARASRAPQEGVRGSCRGRRRDARRSRWRGRHTRGRQRSRNRRS